jgi:hypothetical protein
VWLISTLLVKIFDKYRMFFDKLNKFIKKGVDFFNLARYTVKCTNTITVCVG